MPTRTRPTAPSARRIRLRFFANRIPCLETPLSATDSKTSSNAFNSRGSPTLYGVVAPLTGAAGRPAPAKAGGLPGLFHPPSPRPLFPIWRLFRGCLARHSSRSCAARLKPAFAPQPPSCAALYPRNPRFKSKLHPIPSPFNLDSTSKLHRAFPGPGEPPPGTEGAGKKTLRTIQFNSNPRHSPTLQPLPSRSDPWLLDTLTAVLLPSHAHIDQTQ